MFPMVPINVRTLIAGKVTHVAPIVIVYCVQRKENTTLAVGVKEMKIEFLDTLDAFCTLQKRFNLCYGAEHARSR